VRVTWCWATLSLCSLRRVKNTIWLGLIRGQPQLSCCNMPNMLNNCNMLQQTSVVGDPMPSIPGHVIAGRCAGGSSRFSPAAARQGIGGLSLGCISTFSNWNMSGFETGTWLPRLIAQRWHYWGSSHALFQVVDLQKGLVPLPKLF